MPTGSGGKHRFRMDTVLINKDFARAKSVLIKTVFDLNRGAINTDLIRIVSVLKKK